MRGRTRALSGTVALLLSLVLGGCGAWPDTGAADDGLRILVPNTAGGGYDTTARTVARVLAETGTASDVQVFNLPGAGGTVGLQRTVNERGNGRLALQMGLGVLGASHVVHARVTVRQTTPIARLIEEPEAVVVRKDSPYHTVEEPGAQPRMDAAPRSGVSIGLVVAAVLVPVALMLLRTLAETLLDESSALRAGLAFAGEPLVAMPAGVLFALGVTIVGGGRSGEETRTSLTDSLKSIAAILLIIGGGGAFKQVPQDSGIGDAIASAVEGAHLNVIVLGWLIALLLSLTTGSATVGIVSATGIVAPLIGDGGGLEASLLVVAIGAGSLGLNYVNHAGFWLVKESFGMDLAQATRTQTVVQTLVSVLGLLMALLLSVLA
jgi:hypothetical protein